jgi:hypothetical protein
VHTTAGSRICGMLIGQPVTPACCCCPVCCGACPGGAALAAAGARPGRVTGCTAVYSLLIFSRPLLHRTSVTMYHRTGVPGGNAWSDGASGGAGFGRTAGYGGYQPPQYAYKGAGLLDGADDPRGLK